MIEAVDCRLDVFRSVKLDYLLLLNMRFSLTEDFFKIDFTTYRLIILKSMTFFFGTSNMLLEAL